MNLIEQLGGYEKSKAHRDYLISYGSEFAGASQNSVNELNEAILQYRREHNIFEVGDLVVETSQHTDDQVYKIKEDHGEHCFYVGTNGGDRDFWTLFLGEVRHATPEEIQAGRRLEVCGG